MARRASRGEQVTVAELLVRSAAAHDRRGTVGTGARHREKPQVVRSLARLRVLSVVAGALALTGGVATAVSMPVERSAGPVWPPAGLEPPVSLPSPAAVVAPAVSPESVMTPGAAGGITPASADQESDSASTPAHRGKLAKAVKIVGKGAGKAKPPKQAAPVRHAIPDVPVWSRGRPGGDPGGHHHCGGGGRHRR
ncbi:hypothetical protein [Amycolatopsis sp. NPDC004378]